MSFLYIGDQMTVAYSRMMDLYRFRNISVSMYVKVLKMIPRFLLAMLIFEVMWSLKVNLLSNSTPKSFSLSTFSITGICL